jgi:hypothetical protein
MKLLLHIGTPKTGTTALQQFLHANREDLATRGFHYATPSHGLREASRVAAALSLGKSRAVHGFFAKHVDLARRRGADTLLVSAERFSLMSVVDANMRREVCVNGVERDHALIETLQSLIPKGIENRQIVCYFRRPDRYAESFYSQHVKRGMMFDGTFEDFLPIIRPALLYNQNMRSWSDVFGKENCLVRSYERVGADIVGDFMMNVLNIDDLTDFVHLENAGNERVSRDVLEFKRLRNRSASYKERDMERTILRLVDEQLGLRDTEPDYYQDFMSPDERAEFLRLVQPEIEALQASYDVPPFPPFDPKTAKANWSPYPGLGEELRHEIELRYDSINRRVAFRFERLTLRFAGFLRKYVPSAGVLLDGLKAFGAKHTLRRFMRRIQLGSG